MKKEDKIPFGYARVSEVLSYYKDFSSVDKETLKRSQEKGTLAHDYCEFYALNLLLQEPENHVKGYVKSFKNWFDQYVTELVGTEERLLWEELRITGRYDMIVKIKGSDENVLIDIKTSKTHSNTWPLQTAAYVFMKTLSLRKNSVVFRRATLMIKQDGSEAKFTEYTNYEKDLNCFQSACSVYRYFNS